jgi:hypothetical protein
LRRQGVTEDFFRQVKESGGQYSIDDVIRLRQQGVDGNYVKALNVPARRWTPIPSSISASAVWMRKRRASCGNNN